MKFLLILALLVASMGDAIAQNDRSWALFESKKQGSDRAIVFRYAKTFAPSFQRAMYPDRVILVWKYSSESGMPVIAERERMDRLEDLILPAVEEKAQSVLVLVSTGEGFREWIYYTKSASVFVEKLNETLKTSPRFPIEIHAAPDPTWSTYEAFRKTARQ
jgi:hypothetical protein